VKQYKCSVRLGDSLNNVIPNKVVTISEIVILKAVHGHSAIVDIRPCRDVKDGKPRKDTDSDETVQHYLERADVPRSDAEERERLRAIYDNVLPGESVVDRLLPALQPLPRTLTSIGIDPKAAAEELRRQADALSASAALMDEEPAPESDEDDFFDEEDKAA
jgi:hypothetical protein